jgi:cell wall-associated NlpC family hydrolase
MVIDQKVLDGTVGELERTSYQRMAPREEAPAKTDCVTAIHYLMQKVFQIDFPCTWVGDIPRLLSQIHWNLCIVDDSELQAGDVLFLKHQRQPKLISHAAIALGPDKIFHCTRLLGPIIQTVAQLFEQYEQYLVRKQILYIDPRNRALREQQGGMYIDSLNLAHNR